MTDETQHDPSGTDNPKEFTVPAPMQPGDTRDVPAFGAAQTEPEKVELPDLPEGMEYVNPDDPTEGVRYTDLPWRGY